MDYEGIEKKLHFGEMHERPKWHVSKSAPSLTELVKETVRKVLEEKRASNN